MAEPDDLGRGAASSALGRGRPRPYNQQRDVRPHLNAFAIRLRRKEAGVRLTFGGQLAGLVLVSIQAVNPDAVKRFQIPLPHAREGKAIEPRVIGN